MADWDEALDKLGNVDMDNVGKFNNHQTKEIEYMLKELQEELQNNYKRFSDWEADFVDNLTGFFERSKKLSEKQLNRLRIIYEKYCM